MRRAELIDRAERGNAINWTTYSTLQGLSASFISADLFNTVLMRQGASDFVLGLFAANQLVSLASQFVAARYVDGSRDKVRLMWLSHVIQLLPILLPIALLALTGGQVGLWPFFGAVFFYYLVNSTVGAFGSIANMDLLSRVLRPGGRGKLLGMQGALGGLAGIASGLLVAGIISRLDYPMGYTTVWCTGLSHRLPNRAIRRFIAVSRGGLEDAVQGCMRLRDRQMLQNFYALRTQDVLLPTCRHLLNMSPITTPTKNRSRTLQRLISTT